MHRVTPLPMIALVLIVLAVAQQLPATGPATRPSSSEMFDRLLPDSGFRPDPISPAAAPEVAAGVMDPAQRLRREGTFLVDRIGRLTRREGTLEYEFTFESDGTALEDPPVRVLENLRLMQMEDALAAASRDLRFRITGMLTEYRGRNYVLIEKMVVLSDDQRPF